jgi:integrase
LDPRPWGIYLGPWRSSESKERYGRITAEWLAGGRQLRADPKSIIMAEIVVRFRKWASTYYADADGKDTGEAQNFDHAVRPLLKLYGRTPASEFGPLRLRTVREAMIADGLCRNTVNQRINKVRYVFKWAAENELIHPSVYHGLTALSGLRRGRSEAVESKPVKPISPEHARTIKSHVSAEVGAMIELQLLTGMRPGEICIMRGRDLETVSDDLWLYHPHSHKTQHHGHERCIYLGPKAIEFVTPFLRTNTEEFLFSPTAAMQEKWQIGGNPVGRRAKRRPAKHPGDRYTTGSYARAVMDGCDKAFPPPSHLARQRVPANGRKAAKSTRWESIAEWRQRLGQDRWPQLLKWRQDHRFAVNRLRHTAGTLFRKEFGLEAAQVLLGHKTLTVTQVYAEKNVEAAMRIVKRVG